MKKTFICVLSAIVTGSVAIANPLPPVVGTVYVNGAGGYQGAFGTYQTGKGGEFSLSTTSLSLSAYSPLAKNVGSAITPSFQTFCTEGNEGIAPNTTYNVTLSGVTIYSGDPLTAGVAWLYSQFATGNLAGYDYTGTVAGRDATAAKLQDAIWLLMGGQEGQTLLNNASNPFLHDAEVATGGTFADADTAVAAGTDHVYILNLWKGTPGPNTAAQDQLYLAPDGGSTMILLGAALSGLAIYRRRF